MNYCNCPTNLFWNSFIVHWWYFPLLKIKFLKNENKVALCRACYSSTFDAVTQTLLLQGSEPLPGYEIRQRITETNSKGSPGHLCPYYVRVSLPSPDEQGHFPRLGCDFFLCLLVWNQKNQKPCRWRLWGVAQPCSTGLVGSRSY